MNSMRRTANASKRPKVKKQRTEHKSLSGRSQGSRTAAKTSVGVRKPTGGKKSTGARTPVESQKPRKRFPKEYKLSINDPLHVKNLRRKIQTHVAEDNSSRPQKNRKGKANGVEYNLNTKQRAITGSHNAEVFDKKFNAINKRRDMKRVDRPLVQGGKTVPGYKVVSYGKKDPRDPTKFIGRVKRKTVYDPKTITDGKMAREISSAIARTPASQRRGTFLGTSRSGVTFKIVTDRKTGEFKTAYPVRLEDEFT